MRRRTTGETDERIPVRLPRELWHRLRVEAAQRDQSAALLINELLEERMVQIDRERGHKDE